MAKPAYKEIISNLSSASEEKKNELIKKWNYGEVNIMMNKLESLPLHMQMPVFESLKDDYTVVSNS